MAQHADKSRIYLEIHPEASTNTAVHVMSYIHSLKENSRLNLSSEHLASVIIQA